jgi:hypothetical protein
MMADLWANASIRSTATREIHLSALPIHTQDVPRASSWNLGSIFILSSYCHSAGLNLAFPLISALRGSAALGQPYFDVVSAPFGRK